MTITIAMNDFREIISTVRSVGPSGINWLDAAYLRSVENDMLLVTAGNRYVQHFIEWYHGGVHRKLGEEVVGIPFDVLNTVDRAARTAHFRGSDSIVNIWWDGSIGNIEAESGAGIAGAQTFEVVAQQSDVLDVCAPHFYAEDATRFRVEDAGLLARKLKTASRLFDRDDNKRCEVGWSSASVMNVGLLKEYEWQVVINSRMTGPAYSSVVDQFSPVAFNPELLAEVLGIGDRVVVSLKKDLKGCIFTAGYHTAMLMPIRH